MDLPRFWLVAGVNGAGKTTLTTRKDIRSILGHLDLINPDAIAAEVRRHDPSLSVDAANLLAVQRAEAEVGRRIEAGESVLVETVLSSRKYVPHVERAKARGFYVGMIYIGLPSVKYSIARVADRVALGGHGVPEAKLRQRWLRSLDNLVVFVPLLDRLLIYSNANPVGGPTLVATKAAGKLELLDRDALPEVTRRLESVSALPSPPPSVTPPPSSLT